MRSAPCSAVRRLAALGLLFLVVLVENGRGARGGGEFLNPRPPWAESYVREMTAQFGELFANESNRPLIHARLTLREGVCWTPHRQTGKWLGDVLPNYTVPMRLLRAKHFCEHLGSLCAGVVCNAGSLTECTVRQRRAPTDSGRAMLATGPATDVTFVKACSDSELSFNASSNGYPCAIGHFFALSAASCEPCTGIGTQGNAAFVSHGGIDCSNVLPNAVPFDHSMCDGGPLSCVTGIIGPVANEVIVALPNDSAAAKGALQADFRATAGKVKLNSKLVTPVVALIIGAMKGGTMTLWEALSRHPHVFRTVKEHHYFDTGYDTRTLSEFVSSQLNSVCAPVGQQAAVIFKRFIRTVRLVGTCASCKVLVRYRLLVNFSGVLPEPCRRRRDLELTCDRRSDGSYGFDCKRFTCCALRISHVSVPAGAVHAFSC